MPDAVPAALDDYAAQHTSPPPASLARLDAGTRTELGHPNMLSGPVVGRLLETLVALARPRLVLEVGTFSGASALWMARGLPAGGRIVTCEVDPEHAAFARARFAEAGEARIELVQGPALATIGGLTDPVDFAFVDADKAGYPAYLAAILDHLAPGGTVVLDNMLRGGRVLLDPVEQDEDTRAIAALNARVAIDPALSVTFLTVRDGLTIIRRA